MAQCFRDLGEAAHAARYARRSLDMDGRYVRGRAFNLSLLATAYAAQGEPVQASAFGRQALDLTVRLTSARSIRYVRDLVRALRPQADVPASPWISHTLGISPQAVREDRILDEALATGGDIRRLCDLFGLTVGGAERYARPAEPG